MRRFERSEIFRLPPRDVADAMMHALAVVSRGDAIAPVRAHIDLGNGAGMYLISGGLPEFDLLSVKVINVRPDNPTRQLERLQGWLAVFQSSTGRPLATLDARAATEVRTAACSAVSVRLMARQDASVLVVFGTGPQAAAHLRALTAERNFRELRVVGHRRESAVGFAASHSGTSVAEADRALEGADVVVTATNSTVPLFHAADVRPGTHVVMVGSGSAAAAEAEPELLARAARICVDHRPSCFRESGEIVAALERGLIAEDSVRELGEVVLGRIPGRMHPTDITIYKSVGNGTQDAALAALLLDPARVP